MRCTRTALLAGLIGLVFPLSTPAGEPAYLRDVVTIGTGMRLTGPAFGFSERATNKRPEHGQDPSNILDHGYPLGAINLAGQTPIILINDGPSTGGFINPFTVPSAAFWKLGQALPGNVFRFRAVTVTEAQDRRRALDRLCTAESLMAA